MWLHFLRVKAEEIVVEYTADAQQDACVDGALVVYFIEVGTMTAQFAGKPDRRLALLLNLLAYALPYVYHPFLVFDDT